MQFTLSARGKQAAQPIQQFIEQNYSAIPLEQIDSFFGFTGDYSLFRCSQKLKDRNIIGMIDFDLEHLQSMGFERFKMLRPRAGNMTGFQVVLSC